MNGKSICDREWLGKGRKTSNRVLSARSWFLFKWPESQGGLSTLSSRHILYLHRDIGRKCVIETSAKLRNKKLDYFFARRCKGGKKVSEETSFIEKVGSAATSFVTCYDNDQRY